MTIFLVILVFALGCGILFAEETVPENPIVSAADFDATDDMQTLETEKDETVYVPVPVASSQKDSEQTRKTDTGVSEEPPPPEEEEEPEEQEPEEEEPKEPEKTPTVTPNPAAANANTGDSAGGDTENGMTTDKEYFTTNIKDGETVTDPAYAFEIRHKIEELKVESLEVFVNGKLIPQFQGVVTLTEGENKIRIKVDYADASGKIVATPYKDYTIILDSKSLVINTSLKNNETVSKDQHLFTASASCLGKSVPLKVTCNGSEVKGNNGSYRAKLNAGENKIVLSAESGDLKKTETYTVMYESDGIFDFDTTLTDGMTVTEETLNFEVWMVNGSNNVMFTVAHGQEYLQGSDGEYFTVTLAYGANTISITARDGEQNKTKNYTVYFERPKAGADNPNPDPENAPTIETDPQLTEGEPFTTNNGTFTLNVYAYDRNGGTLTGGSMELSLNGSPVRSDWTSGNSAVYRLHLTLPENVITVYVEDSDGYSRYYTYTVLYENTDGPIGYVTMSVEATTLGLGYIIEPEQVPIYSNQPASYVLKDFLENHGYVIESTGELDGQYYLARIHKPGITNGWNIPDNLETYLAEANATPQEFKVDSLGEFDFYDEAGWMVDVDGLYTGYGFGDMYLTDGQSVAVRFSLAMGRDIDDSLGDRFPEIFIEQP
ncbi:MAG: hypothetical protein IJF43_04345 [Firmicutes bacterium]|nr:hypothetical protein [Bacillota bacterium]